MKAVFLILVISVAGCYGLDNYLTGEFYDCLKCLCHSVSGCYYRQNCARYSINFDYWQAAGAPTVLDNERQDQIAYTRCLADENCIAATVKKYTDKYSADCNCDGIIDCKDRLAIHLSGTDCINPIFGTVKANRFNNCVSHLGLKSFPIMKGEEKNCEIPAF